MSSLTLDLGFKAYHYGLEAKTIKKQKKQKKSEFLQMMIEIRKEAEEVTTCYLYQEMTQGLLQLTMTRQRSVLCP